MGHQRNPVFSEGLYINYFLFILRDSSSLNSGIDHVLERRVEMLDFDGQKEEIEESNPEQYQEYGHQLDDEIYEEFDFEVELKLNENQNKEDEEEEEIQEENYQLIDVEEPDEKNQEDDQKFFVDDLEHEPEFSVSNLYQGVYRK
jgi:hypothetical protein